MMAQPTVAITPLLAAVYGIACFGLLSAIAQVTFGHFDLVSVESEFSIVVTGIMAGLVAFVCVFPKAKTGLLYPFPFVWVTGNVAWQLYTLSQLLDPPPLYQNACVFVLGIALYALSLRFQQDSIWLRSQTVARYPALSFNRFAIAAGLHLFLVLLVTAVTGLSGWDDRQRAVDV